MKHSYEQFYPSLWVIRWILSSTVCYIFNKQMQAGKKKHIISVIKILKLFSSDVIIEHNHFIWLHSLDQTGTQGQKSIYTVSVETIHPLS